MKMTSKFNVVLSKVYIGKETENRLISSAGQGDVSSVLKLLRKRVNPNLRDELGVTALARAAEGGHAEVVRILIESGAEVNITVPSNVSPLHLAAKGSIPSSYSIGLQLQSNHTEAVKHLILAGAKLDCETASGVRPINFTKVHSETWQVLLAASHGEVPEIEEISEVPEIPNFAIKGGAGKLKTKSGKKKKGKKGGKKGKKKGKKKKK